MDRQVHFSVYGIRVKCSVNLNSSNVTAREMCDLFFTLVAV